MTDQPITNAAGARRVPTATYRLQFNREFTFQHAVEIADYLRDLGISDCYASPLFRATPQSTHGYDICGFGEINPALGGIDQFARFASRFRELGLGLLLDMVPNHMGADLSNAWWVDVLERGEWSAYAKWFDIDWRRGAAGAPGKVLLPVLEDHYAKVLEAGKLKLVFDAGAFGVAYYDRKIPLAPRSAARILRDALAHSPAGAPPTDAMRNVEGFIDVLGRADGAGSSQPAELSKVKEQLAHWVQSSVEFRTPLTKTIDEINGAPGNPRSFDRLHAILQEQHYRLVYWRLGPAEINYRRFFDIPELVSLRMELPEVFDATHALVLDLIRKGDVTGLRIDHPDGLWDPRQYFERLQSAIRQEAGSCESPQLAADRGAAEKSPAGAPRAPFYILAEKILSGDEQLPGDWPVAGTTGYDFLNQVNGLFVNRAHRENLDAFYREFAERPPGWSFYRLVNHSKKRILQSSMASDLESLARLLERIASQTRYGLDFAPRQIQLALTEVIAAFPVYRTYVTEQSTKLSWVEKDCVAQAVRDAGLWNPALDPAVLSFLDALLRLQPLPDLDSDGIRLCREFAMHFQQLTSPAMAKGLEDTAFYNYNRLVSLNEVGGDPETFGIGINEFHGHTTQRAQHWPHSLLATATHDTKRGEDIRARINVLSEIPGEWRRIVTAWRDLNADKKAVLDGQLAPDHNDEYLIYQMLIGAWDPATKSPEGLSRFGERIANYMLKAIKEAKVHTSWTEPNSAYEEATRHFIEMLLMPSEGNAFLEGFRPFQRKLAFFGHFNSLAQVLLKMVAPGVPDFYQGTELWDLNLVDPDNRRPVDYAPRRALLNQLKELLSCENPDLPALLKRLLDETETGQVKLYLIWRVLNFRREHRDLFDHGEYVPLIAVGTKKEHVCAFARRFKGEEVIAIAPRLVLRLANGLEKPPIGKEIWEQTFLPVPAGKGGPTFRNILSGETVAVSDPAKGIAVAEALKLFPVALLERV